MAHNRGAVFPEKGRHMLVRHSFLAPNGPAVPRVWLSARNALVPRLDVCAPRTPHQSRALFASHWPIGSSPPAAGATSVSVPARHPADVSLEVGGGEGRGLRRCWKLRRCSLENE